jgi:hypothetical protein
MSFYDIKQSCLYKCKNKSLLCRYLQSTIKDINFFIKQGDDAYSVFTLEKNGKKRECQKPKNQKLNRIHARIKYLLQSIQTSDYLFSGKKRLSSIDNAAWHLSNAKSCCVKLDINQFFQSITFVKIYNFFHLQMKCSADVAYIITKLSCYNNNLSTGCKMSMHIAYFSCKDLFDDIFKTAHKYQCKYSIWVDDITISGDNAKKVGEISKSLIKKYGLRVNNDKCQIFKPHKTKQITGVLITKDEKLSPLNKHFAKCRKLENHDNPLTVKDKIQGVRNYIKNVKNISKLKTRIN